MTLSDYYAVLYDEACHLPSDINELIPVLYDYACKCQSVTEFGVRGGVSTRAFFHANPKKLTCYDIRRDPNVVALFTDAKSEHKDWKFIEADVLSIEIDDTDMLFIDTFHCYEQLKEELSKHGRRAQKYIGFHDTHTFGWTPEQAYGKYGTAGIMPAILEFLVWNPEWRIEYQTDRNNGLTVIARSH